jgi:hypothetical protein
MLLLYTPASQGNVWGHAYIPADLGAPNTRSFRRLDSKEKRESLTKLLTTSCADSCVDSCASSIRNKSAKTSPSSTPPHVLTHVLTRVLTRVQARFENKAREPHQALHRLPATSNYARARGMNVH